MSELLVYVRTSTNPDPTIDRQGCWKPGMVVDRKPDLWEWNPSELWPAYKILKLPGVSDKDTDKWLLPEYNDVALSASGVYRRRRYVINLALLTPILEATLVDTKIDGKTRAAALSGVTIDKYLSRGL
jgi:hypothetical protein